MFCGFVESRISKFESNPHQTLFGQCTDGVFLCILYLPKGRKVGAIMQIQLELLIPTPNQYEFELGPPDKPELPPPDPGDPSPFPQLDD